MKRVRNDFFEEENTSRRAVKEDKVFSKSEQTPRQPRKQKAEKPKKEGGKKKTALIVIICVVAFVLIAAAVLGYLYFTRKAEEERQQEVVNQILSVEVFHEGVVIDGVDVTGLTKDEAKQFIMAAHAEEDGQQVVIKKSSAFDEAKAAAEQRAAEEAAKQEAAAQAATQAAENAADGEAEEEAADEVILDENGMPVEEVPEEEEEAAPRDLLYTVDENGNFVLSANCIKISYNIDEVLEEAFGLAKAGSYEELLAEVDDIKTNGREFSIERTLDVSGIKAALQQIADNESIAPADAKVEFNTNYTPAKEGEAEAEKFTYVNEVPGVTIDVESTFAAVEAMAQQGTIGEIEMMTVDVAPTTTVEDLQNSVVLRGSATTEFKGSLGYKERVHNITKAAGMVNGVVVQPGETFSMNKTIGVRNKANGWQMAGALSGGQSGVKQYGGGVCQVSTTMYNAVVKGDLEIVYRQAHSEKSSYVKGGLDATINSVGNEIDFKWKNNTDSPVMIVAYVNGYTVTVDIYGAPFATDEYDEIKLTSQQLSTIEPSGEHVYQVIEGKPADYKEEKVKRRNGSKWQSFKNYYKNGELVKTEKLAVSTYKAYAGLTYVGTMPSASPSVSPGTSAGTTTQQPASTPSKAPETTTPAPETTTPAPETTTPAPETTTPAPEANTETPAA